MKRTGKTYVVVTDDGPAHQNVFLTWSTEMFGIIPLSTTSTKLVNMISMILSLLQLTEREMPTLALGAAGDILWLFTK